MESKALDKSIAMEPVTFLESRATETSLRPLWPELCSMNFFEEIQNMLEGLKSVEKLVKPKILGMIDRTPIGL